MAMITYIWLKLVRRRARGRVRAKDGIRVEASRWWRWYIVIEFVTN